MQTSTKEFIEFYERRGFWGEESLESLFRRTVAIHPGRIALCDPPDRESFVDGPPQRLTYSDLFTAVRDVSAKLLAAGVKKDHVVVSQLPNTVETVILYLAVARIGALLCPVSVTQSLSSLSEISLFLAPFMYVGGRYQNRNLLQQARTWLPESCLFASFQDEQVTGDMVSLSLAQPALPEAIRLLGQIMDANLVTPNEVFTLTWRRHTAKYPAIPRTHNQWFAMASFVAEGAGLCNGDNLLCAFSLADGAGIGAMLYNWLMAGGRMVLNQSHNPKVLLQQMREEHVASAGLPVETLAELVAALDGSEDLSQLRSVITGFENLDSDSLRASAKALSVTIVNCYSTNEGACLLTAPADRESGWQESLFPRFEVTVDGWTSRMSRMVGTRLKSLEGKDITKPGQPGLLFIKGPSLFDHYYQGGTRFEIADEPEQVFSEDGYQNTGDLFVIDEKNPSYYRFLGRG